MKLTHLKKPLILLLGLLPFAAWGQSNSHSFFPARGTTDNWGPRQGDRELTIAGSGASSKRLDDSFGGVNFTLGGYFNDNLEGLIRQSVNYSNPARSRQEWNGATRIALDQHFLTGAFRPYFGINFGGVYGDMVRDTWAAGLEGGAKLYMQPKTFLFVGIDYSWFFQHARALESRFDDGQFFWNAGIGYNF
jgi:hypothetical protein